ncbi:zf-TFIIB domain-containing protein [bacterium]|nr:zf-TFIIB domain-containing protein [bacterium]
MLCPNCNSQMKKVEVRSLYGAKIEIDQCPVCGGIWCDKFELYRISFKEGIKIDRLDIDRLAKLKPIKNNLVCPKCNIFLKKFNDPNFPQQIHLDYCPHCGGVWLNRGELSQFKEWQRAKIEYSKKELTKKDKELSEQVKRMMALEKSNKYEIAGKIARFLNQPVYGPQWSYTEQIFDKDDKLSSVIYTIFHLMRLITKVLIKK